MSTHQTVAANRLDPNVSADGHFHAGPGVGAQDPSHVQREGGEHLTGSNTSSNPLSSTSTTGATTTGAASDRVHDQGIDHIKSRLDDRGAPLGSTSATTSAAAPSGVPASETEQSQGGIVGTIKSYLGFTGAESDAARRAEDVGPASVHSATSAGTGTSGTHGTASSDLPGTHSSSTIGRHDGTNDGTTSSNTHHNSSSTTAGSAAAGVGAAAASALGYDEHNKHNTSSLPDRTRDTTTTGSSATDRARDNTATGGSLSDRTHENVTGGAANESFDKPGSSTTGSSTTGPQDPSIDSSAAGTKPVPTEATGSAQPTEHKSTGNEKDLKSGANPKSLEHPEAIPTAGGEKLGQKHWGESKIVPDNPKPVGSEAGVSSAAGQSTSEVKDNTAKNTGGATSGPQGQDSTTTGSHGTTDETGKESLTDKIKDKLHIGSKN